MSMAYAKKQLAYYREMMGMPDNPPDLLAKKDAEIAHLRTALIHIRDSTYRDAITLRGLADKALAEQKEQG